MVREDGGGGFGHFCNSDYRHSNLRLDSLTRYSYSTGSRPHFRLDLFQTKLFPSVNRTEITLGCFHNHQLFGNNFLSDDIFCLNPVALLRI